MELMVLSFVRMKYNFQFHPRFSNCAVAHFDRVCAVVHRFVVV